MKQWEQKPVFVSLYLINSIIKYLNHIADKVFALVIVFGRVECGRTIKTLAHIRHTKFLPIKYRPLVVEGWMEQ